MYPNEIKDKNITLRHLEPTLKNATILNQLVHDNALYLSPVFNQMVQAYKTPQGTLACLKYDEECYLRNQMLPYYIFKDDVLVGEITADWHDKEGITEIIYWLDKKHTGKGYASDALKLMEQALFRMGHKSIRLCIDATNYCSSKVAQKNGYQLSSCTNYYFKTWQMYCHNYRKICQHKNMIKRYGFWSELFR